MRVKGTPISDPPLRLAPRHLKKEYKEREREREREKEAKQFPIAEIAAMTLNYSHT
jgi:hypothetical protein